MSEKLALIWPEIVLFGATCVVMVVGLSRNVRARHLSAWISGLALVLAAALASQTPPVEDALFPALIPYAKGLVATVGLLVLLLLAGTVDRDLEGMIASGKTGFNALRTTRAEFYSFFLFSLTGLMLTVSADDLIWLFLALELTSLPTYIMVTISTRGTKSQEAGVKYFFLGALGAAFFLYGFALLYGQTGTTSIPGIASYFAAEGIGPIGVAGLLISLIGISFKIAAVPMHFYTADVYQGAAAPVSAMLAFVPKTAGFIAIFLIAGTAGWGHGDDANRLPEAVHALLWIIAALTMTVGNVLAILQDSVKRIMAYSSIAHSGYMLVGVLVGPGPEGGPFWQNGIAAVLFYLMCYGVMNLGVFAVLGCLERRDGSEPDSIDDVRGLVKTRPVLGWVLVLCSLSMLGFPPLLGFVGKAGLFASAVSAGLIPMVVILGVNSAIAAFYYLRIVAAAYLEPRDEPLDASDVPFPTRRLAAVLSAGGVVAVLVVSAPILDATTTAAAFDGPGQIRAQTPPPPADPDALSLVED